MIEELVKYWEEYSSDFEQQKIKNLRSLSIVRVKLLEDYKKWGLPTRDLMEPFNEKINEIDESEPTLSGFMDYLSDKFKKDEEETN